MLEAVILSDIHLGSDNCQAKMLCRLLELIVHRELATARLILNGDVFDSIDFRRLTKWHWKVLSLIRKLSDHVEITWICGNHDGSPEIVSHLLGVTVCDEFILESGEEKILVMHGHIFDEFLDKHPILSWFGDVVYAFLQWLDGSHAIARYAKHRSKTFLRCSQKITDGAIRVAQHRGCTAVCCGHTHHPVANTQLALPYFNSGSWTELPCTYLTVLDGIVRLHTFNSADPLESLPTSRYTLTSMELEEPNSSYSVT
jgi:UDP-2,3-diacylglucosamine pyrophosphatase LpxH